MSPLNDPSQAAEAGMVWGIKKSFLTYLSRTPDSLSSVTDGANLTEGGSYHYRLASTPTASPTVLRFEGSVRFTAHAGALAVGFTDPEIILTPEGASMSIVDHFASEQDARLLFATGTVADAAWRDAARITIEQLRLTDAGADLFQHIYKAGESFEDIVVTVSPTGATQHDAEQHTKPHQ